MIDPGTPAPGFTLPSDTGGDVTLADFRGRKVILYFYPKDNTPGCIREACSFRDSLKDIEQAGAVVLGVSSDTIASHEKFVGKHGLNFPLLSDADSKVATAYGAWGEKKLYGRTFMGMHRMTFLIGEDGNIQKVWAKVKPDGHGQEVLDAIKTG